MDKCYPGFMRLHKSWEYQLVRKMGCKYNTPHFVLLVLENSEKNSRLGITVTRKVGNAVERNRLKRVVREFFRKSQIGYAVRDYSVIVKRGSALLSSSELTIELYSLFLKMAVDDD